tara:strand:- start:144 stop:293 length:150 start_codon:yes stop_codon:yes gene_type:complete
VGDIDPPSGGLTEVIKVCVFYSGSGASSEQDTINKTDSSRISFFIKWDF